MFLGVRFMVGVDCVMSAANGYMVSTLRPNGGSCQAELSCEFIASTSSQVRSEKGESMPRGAGGALCPLRPAAADSTARKRWKILASALLGETPGIAHPSDVSVRRFTSFGILAPNSSEEEWHTYETPDGGYSVVIRRPSSSPTARDLMGFNNTGNVCVWPSEETLSVFITHNLRLFSGKRVLELGGGMSCMAGLIVAKYAAPAHVTLTDGNFKSVENVKSILKRNNLQDTAACFVLQWENTKRDRNENILEHYDVILVADCLFFDEVREDLIRTIFTYLSDCGIAYVMAPKRGDTLRQFVTFSESFGFSCEKFEKYSDIIWNRHLELLETDPHYDSSLHYPILLKLTKSA